MDIIALYTFNKIDYITFYIITIGVILDISDLTSMIIADIKDFTQTTIIWRWRQSMTSTMPINDSTGVEESRRFLAS